MTFFAFLFLLFIPGFLACRAARLPRPEAVGLSAPITVLFLVVCGIALDALGFLGPRPMWVCLVVFVLLAGFLSLSQALSAKGEKENVSCLISKSSFIEVAAASLVGFFFMVALFVVNLDGPDSFLEFADNVTHLNVIACMIDGGSFSVMHVAEYSAVPDQSAAPYELHGGGFYPAGWHIVVSMACYLTSALAPVGENVGSLVFAGVVFPLGISLFLVRVFPNKKGIALVGSFAYCACAAFPLAPLDVHQIYPNVAGWCCVPGVLSVFAGRMRDSENAFEVMRGCAVCIAPLLGIAFLHPNAAIIFCVVAVLCLVFLPWKNLANLPWRGLAIAIPFGLLAVGLLLWCVLMDASIFRNVTNYLWGWTVSPEDALAATVGFGFTLGIPQYAFAAAVLIGFVACVKHRNTCWMSASLFMFLLIFFFNACGDPSLKRAFAGYWYTDPERTAAVAALAAIPCASLGLYIAANAITQVLLSFSRNRLIKKIAFPISTAFIVSMFCLLNYAPVQLMGSGPSAIGFRTWELATKSAVGNRVYYTCGEKDFVDRAKSIVGDGGLVLNLPFDGSVLAYSADDMNVYYKSTCGNGETEDSVIIRNRLRYISTDSTVKEAVGRTGAKYVMLLDRGEKSLFDSAVWGEPGDPGWQGFSGLDNNDGFETVMAEGDKRLYKILD